MIRILEEIKETDYKKDISEYLTKTIDTLCSIEQSIKKDSYNIPLYDISTRIHNTYNDILNLYLKLNINTD